MSERDSELVAQEAGALLSDVVDLLSFVGLEADDGGTANRGAGPCIRLMANICRQAHELMGEIEGIEMRKERASGQYIHLETKNGR